MKQFLEKIVIISKVFDNNEFHIKADMIGFFYTLDMIKRKNIPKIF